MINDFSMTGDIAYSKESRVLVQLSKNMALTSNVKPPFRLGDKTEFHSRNTGEQSGNICDMGQGQ